MVPSLSLEPLPSKVQVSSTQDEVNDAVGAALAGPEGPTNIPRVRQSRPPVGAPGAASELTPDGAPSTNAIRRSSPLEALAKYRVCPERNMPWMPLKPVEAATNSSAARMPLSTENPR